MKNQLISLMFLSAFMLYTSVGISQSNLSVQKMQEVQGQWVAEEKEVQAKKDTNGLSCVFYISNRPLNSGQTPPVCILHIKNMTTNILKCWGGFYGETYSKIELLNTNGDLIKKTTEGKGIGTRVDDVKIREMIDERYKNYVEGHSRTPGYIIARPGENAGGIMFSIPQLFEIKTAGEYTLKIQTCLIQSIGGENYNPNLKITWFPELVVPIQIHPEGVTR
jgi:hypothetical protein